MKRIVWLVVLLLTARLVPAQKLKKADKAIITSLETNIGYLADDKLEGRRTGSAGEKLAYEYISNEFNRAGLTPKAGNNGFIQDFEVNEGRQINPSSHLIINVYDLAAELFQPRTFRGSARRKKLTARGTAIWAARNAVPPPD